MAALSIGESLIYLGAVPAIDKKTYSKILLNNETEGWARKGFIVPDAKPVVVLGGIDLYFPSDMLPKAGKKFSVMDIVSSIKNLIPLGLPLYEILGVLN